MLSIFQIVGRRVQHILLSLAALFVDIGSIVLFYQAAGVLQVTLLSIFEIHIRRRFNIFIFRHLDSIQLFTGACAVRIS